MQTASHEDSRVKRIDPNDYWSGIYDKGVTDGNKQYGTYNCMAVNGDGIFIANSYKFLRTCKSFDD